jgi:hypothetical protein
MPWYPFFQKMKQADIFIVLTHCQFEKNGFQNRFNIDGTWKTMSVYKGMRPINEKAYVDPKRDWNRIKTSMPNYVSQLELFDECIADSLVATNTAIIRKIADILNINTEIVIDHDTGSAGTQRLVDLCKHYSAKKYIAGTSGRKYLNECLFAENNIELTYQNEADMIKKSVLEVMKADVR